MEKLIDFIVELVKHAGIALLMLVVGLLFAPEGLTYSVLRKLKPDLIRRTPFMTRVRDAFEIMLGKKVVVPPAGAGAPTKARLAAIQASIKEREILQGNLFFLDLLKNLSGMLYFAVSQDGQRPQAALPILEQALNYLRNYSRELRDSATFKTETADVELATGALDRVVLDAQKFLGNTAEGESELFAVRATMRMGVERFDGYMQDRYVATSTALETVSQKLAEQLAYHVECEDV